MEEIGGRLEDNKEIRRIGLIENQIYMSVHGWERKPSPPLPKHSVLKRYNSARDDSGR